MNIGALPQFLRTATASAGGVFSQHRRYGFRRSLEARVRVAERHEYLEESQRSRATSEHLSALLARAAQTVPFYRDHWRGREWPATLDEWPIVSKKDLRLDGRRFVSDRPDGGVRKWQTSGSSGTPVTIWHASNDLRNWFGIFERRWRRWNAVSYRDPWAIIGGRVIKPFEESTPPFWIANYGQRQLYLSAYHIAPESAQEYVNAISRWGAKYLWSYPSSAYALARHAAAAGVDPPKLACVILNAEPVYPWQRIAIADYYRAPVVETYGMAEMCYGASQCETGRMHGWSDAGIIRDVGGKTLFTGLVNQTTILINYDLGDEIVLENAGHRCDCGRTLPLIKSITGRADDVIVTPDGRSIGRLDPIFKGGLPIREAQIEQVSVDTVEIRVVPDAGWSDQSAQALNAAATDRLGTMQIRVRLVQEIPRAPNGKFRGVIAFRPGSREETHI